jgi:hypothetical protein
MKFVCIQITAVTAAKVWVLDRRVFQQVMKKTGLQRIDDNVNFLRSVPLLSNLSIDHMAKIADVLEVVSCSVIGQATGHVTVLMSPVATVRCTFA